METKEQMKKFKSNGIVFLNDYFNRFLHVILVSMVMIGCILFVLFPFYEKVEIIHSLWSHFGELLTKPSSVIYIAGVMAIVAVLVFLHELCRITMVFLGKTGITIKRGVKSPCFIAFESYRISSYKKGKNTRDGIKEHFYIQTIDSEEQIRNYEMAFFSVEAYTRMMSEIHENQKVFSPEGSTENMFDILQAEEKSFLIPRREVMKKEWIWYTKVSILSLVLAGFCLFISLRIPDRHQHKMLLLAIIWLAYIPVQFVRNLLDSKKCPERISICGGYLSIDARHFSVRDVERISLITRADDNSEDEDIRWYIIIYTNGKKHTYWLGSDESMPEKTYREICQEIEKLLKHNPDKVVYIPK